MLKFLIEKEFKQITRNAIIPKLIILFPMMIMLIFPWAATMEYKNLNISIVDHDHSTFSERLIHKISASTYFQLVDLPSGYDQALHDIESNRADLILEIQPDFEKSLVREGTASAKISANSVNGMKAGLGVSYLSGILSDYAGEIRDEWVQTSGKNVLPVIQIISQNWFNPHLDYKLFMIPALMVMLLTLLCGFLPALNIVSEKEIGTIEQINVTPVSKLTFALGKLIPYWIMGFIVLSICFGLAALVYGITPAGHLVTIYFFAGIYLLAVSGLGLVISNYSNTMQQAMFVMFFFIMIFILMSGLFTPITSMPEWAQAITVINPLKYFIQVMRMAYMKGSGIGDLTMQLVALSSFAVILNLWAVASYKKSQ